MIVVFRTRSSTSNDGQVRVCPGTCRHVFVCRFADRQGTICLAGSQACIDSRFVFLRGVALLCDRTANGGLLKFDGAS